MHVFNRLLVIVLDLCLLVAVVAVLLVLLGWSRPQDLAPAPWFVDRLVPFTRLDPISWGWAVGIGFGLLLIGLVLLAFELRPGRREEPRLLLREDGLGRVTVTRSGVRRLVEHEAGQVDGVRQIRSHVRNDQRGLHILCRVAVDPATNLPAMTQTLQERLKAVAERSLGLPVAEVRVETQVEPLVSDGRVARRVR